MEALEIFKNYLIKEKTSKATVKNYIADVRKFIRWYESYYSQPFHPLLVSHAVIEAFKAESTNSSDPASIRSLKRYISSLRKFFHFLLTLGAIPADPLISLPSEKTQAQDPWHFKEFKNFLFVSKASPLTIKNYVIDIRQFLTWLEEVTRSVILSDPEQSEGESKDFIFTKINSFTIEEYKNRLLRDRQLSPVSINRKLSSLRRYTAWLNSKGLMHKDLDITDLSYLAEKDSLTFAAVSPVEAAVDIKELSSFLPQGEESREPASEILGAQAGNSQKSQAIAYSKFPPLRLLQKIKDVGTHAADLLIILPFVRLLEAAKYGVWKIQGRKVFAPLSEVVPELSSQTNPTNLPSFPKPPKILSFPNFPKSMYSPLTMSTKHFSLYKKIIFHIRHTRPNWYKRYHSYAVVHYFHFAVFIVFATSIGFGTYQSFFEAPSSQKAVLSASTTAPPRVIPFQGRLTDSTGTPITSATNLRFALYNSQSASGSAMLWEEVQNITPNKDGVFSASVGRMVSISQELFANNSSLYLGLSVERASELQPRKQLTTTDYAQSAETLQGLSPITQANAGTSNVILALDSSGDLSIGGSGAHTFQATGGEFTIKGKTLTLATTEGSNGNVQITPDGLGIVDIQRPIQNTTDSSSEGGVPGAVEINDLLALVSDSSSQSAFTINQKSTGALISAQVNGIAKFSLDNSGSASLAGSLEISGTSLTTNSMIFNLVNTSAAILNIGGAANYIALGASSSATTINGSLRTEGNITPLKNSTYDLGSNGSYWKDAYLTNVFMSPTATTSGFWQRNNGVLSPTNPSEGIRIEGSITATNIQTTNNENVTVSAGLVVNNSSGGDLLTASSSGTTKFTIANNGNITVVGSAVTCTLGNGTSATSCSSSDQRLKTNIAALTQTSGLDSIRKLSPVSYNWNAWMQGNGSTASLQYGFIAQDVATVFPNMVEQDKNTGFYKLDYQGFFAPIIKSIQELDAKVSSVTENITIGGQTLQQYIAQTVSDVVSSQLAVHSSSQVISPVLEANITHTNFISPLASGSAISVSLDDSTFTIHADKTATSAAVATIDNQGNASFSGTLRTKRLIADSIDGLDDKLATLAAALNQQNANPSIYNSISATPTPTVSLQNPTSSESGQTNPTTNDQGLTTNIASFSGQLGYIPNFKADFGTFTQGLIALGPTSLTDVAISNSLHIGSSMTIEDNSINTIGTDLNIQPFRQGNLSLMGSSVVIDTDGNLNVNGNANFAKDVTIKGKLTARLIAPVPDEDLIIQLGGDDQRLDQHKSALVIKNASGSGVLTINHLGDIIASGAGKFKSIATNGISIIRGAQADTSFTETVASGSAGTSIITANETERTIYTPFVKEDSLIYVTATSDTQGQTPYVARQTATSFTIQLPSPITTNVKFNWWVVN